jgi:hypothetical protein
MAVLVVDLIEAIEVDAQDRHTLAVAAGICEPCGR